MIMAMKRSLVASLLLVGLCACEPTTVVIRGQRIVRPTFGYTDNKYFALQHRRAYPEERGPSSGVRSYAGYMQGTVCGIQVNIWADYLGRKMRLQGFVQPLTTTGFTERQLPIYTEVYDRGTTNGGERHFRGYIELGGVGFRSGWDFTVSQNGLTGWIGRREYNLSAKDDAYTGMMKAASYPYPFELRGFSAFWSMPAADQATVLPFMLTCFNIAVARASYRPLLVVDLEGGDPKGQGAGPHHLLNQEEQTRPPGSAPSSPAAPADQPSKAPAGSTQSPVQ